MENVEEQLTIYSAVPIICRGTACEFSKDCPLVGNGLVGRWVEQGCPLEAIDAFRHFAGYVNDLRISPSDYSDIQTINDLVRLIIQLSRCDKLIRRESPVETMVIGTDSRTGLKHSARQPNQLLELQRRLRQDIAKHYQTLLASREARREMDRKSNVASDISTEMASILEKYEKENRNGG